jgi:hypothetical protein
MSLNLRLAFCAYPAAKFAVEHWHYSKRMPDSKCVKVGVWEDEKFIGVVIFSRGVSSSNLAKRFGIKTTEMCELSRVALRAHATPVSRIVAIALKMLRKFCPGIKLIVSYADANMGHVGGIYQAGNWIYNGESSVVPIYKAKNGRVWHDRSVSNTGFKEHYGRMTRCPKKTELEKIDQIPKHRYFMSFDPELAKKIERKPFPKKSCGVSVDSDTPGFQPGKGGANPTTPLPSLPGEKLTIA